MSYNIWLKQVQYNQLVTSKEAYTCYTPSAFCRKPVMNEFVDELLSGAIRVDKKLSCCIGIYTIHKFICHPSMSIGSKIQATKLVFIEPSKKEDVMHFATKIYNYDYPDQREKEKKETEEEEEEKKDEEEAMSLYDIMDVVFDTATCPLGSKSDKWIQRLFESDQMDMKTSYRFKVYRSAQSMDSFRELVAFKGSLIEIQDNDIRAVATSDVLSITDWKENEEYYDVQVVKRFVGSIPMLIIAAATQAESTDIQINEQVTTNICALDINITTKYTSNSRYLLEITQQIVNLHNA